MARRDLTNRERLDELLTNQRPPEQPRISIYMPTHRRPPDNEGDPILFKNLIQEAEKELEQKYPRRSWETAIASLYRLQDENPRFWHYTGDGLAVLASGEELAVFPLMYTPQAKVFINSSFHILPLLGYMERFDEVYLAEIGRDRARLYSANRYSHEPYLPDFIATNFTDLFDDFDRDADLNFGSYGGQGSSYHGHRTRSEEQEKDRDKYFKYLDEAFSDLYRRDKRKILLAGTTESLSHFRQLARGDFYLEQMIDQPLDSLEDNDRQALIARAMDPIFRGKLDEIGSRLRRATADERIETRIGTIAQMAKEGRLAEIIVDRSRVSQDDTRLDHVILDAMRNGTVMTVLNEGMEDLGSPYTAILRY